MENSLEALLSKSRSVLIVLPTNPYFDQVAAALALSLSLRGTKETTVFSPSAMTVEFNRLVGVNKIKEEIGDKNLVIKFTDYDGRNIERVSADIDGGEFQLTVIPKPEMTAPQKGNIDLSYSGVASDTVILIGGASDTHFPIAASDDLTGAQFIHIGIRPLTLTSVSNVASFTQEASSISELVAGHIVSGKFQSMTAGADGATQQSLFALEADVATNLIMGIEDATNSFSSSTVGANTFALMADLMRAGGQRQPKRPIPNNFPEGAIPQAPQKSEEKPMQEDKEMTPEQPQQNETTGTQEKGAPRDWLAKPRIYKGTTNQNS